MSRSISNDVDVLVVGGGPSGLIAAIAAARLGAKTLVIEREGYLGGTATAGMVCNFFGFFHKEKQVVRGIPEEFIERIKEAGGSTGFTPFIMGELTSNQLPLYGFPTNPEITKIVADEIVSEAHVGVLFHTLLVGVLMEGRRVTGVVTEGIGGRRETRAKVIVDATGDAVVASKAGAEVMGEEEQVRKVRMPSTLVFRLSDVDVPRARAMSREEKRKIVLRGIQQKELFWENLNFPSTPANNDAIPILSRITGLDTLDDEDLSRVEMIGRQQIKSIVNFLRREVAGFEKCNLVGIAPRAGIRETRRVVGLYTLTEQDTYDSPRFEDAVALASGPMDIHDHAGTGIFLKWPDRPFKIPMRCLIPASVEGLVITGRAISTKRPANCAIRFMGTAMSLGQAAGVIGAVAARNGIPPRRVSSEEVQNILRENGAILSAEDTH